MKIWCLIFSTVTSCTPAPRLAASEPHIVVPPKNPTQAVSVPSVAFIPGEQSYLPVLAGVVEKEWPKAHPKSSFAAQIQQETCPSLRSKKCWSPTAELKTEREYGFGLGQLTVTPKFNNFNEAKKLSPELKDWTWENRYNAEYQIRTMVLMDKFAHGKLAWAKNDHERMAMTFSSYNGGLGGVLSDRTVCRATPGCDPAVWFGHIENTSKKMKVPVSGYGQSFFQINRGYVRNVLGSRRDRYREYFGEK